MEPVKKNHPVKRNQNQAGLYWGKRKTLSHLIEEKQLTQYNQ